MGDRARMQHHQAVAAALGDRRISLINSQLKLLSLERMCRVC
jgi:hypothetical protein